MYAIDASYGNFSEVDGQCNNTDNGATNPSGVGCDNWNPSQCGSYGDEDFRSEYMCCACENGGARGPITPILWENESAPMDGISYTWEGGVKVVGDSVFFAFRRGAWSMDSAQWNSQLNNPTSGENHQRGHL